MLQNNIICNKNRKEIRKIGKEIRFKNRNRYEYKRYKYPISGYYETCYYFSDIIINLQNLFLLCDNKKKNS